jgi:hypothetical protein
MPISVLDLGKAITAPQRALCDAEGVSLSLLTGLFASGDVDSVIIGGRFRHVILASWVDYVRRRQLGLERDPVEREAAAASYRNSVQPYSTAAARRALAGKPRPGRSPGTGTKHRKPVPSRRATAETVLPARRSSPQQPVRGPKSKSTAASPN